MFHIWKVNLIVERKQKGTLNALRCLCEYVEKSTGFKAECVLMIRKQNLEAPVYEILRNLKSYNRVARIKATRSKKYLFCLMLHYKKYARIRVFTDP